MTILSGMLILGAVLWYGVLRTARLVCAVLLSVLLYRLVVPPFLWWLVSL